MALFKGLSEEQITSIFYRFSIRSEVEKLDGKLNKVEFIRLYNELQSDSLEKLEDISEFVFSAFDKENSKI